jgi:flagellar FliL protein
MAEGDAMGEEEKTPAAAPAEGAAAEKKSLFSGKNLIILGVLVLVLLGASVFVVFKVIKPMVAGDQADQALDSMKKKEAGIIFSLDPEFVVNVAGTGANRYLRVSISIEVNDLLAQQEISKRGTQLRDTIIQTLGAKKMEQLDNVSSREELKREILNKINDMLQNRNVTDIYFTDFVIQ